MSDERIFRVRVVNIRLKLDAASNRPDSELSRRYEVHRFVAEHVSQHGVAPRIVDVQKMHIDRFGVKLPKSSAGRWRSEALTAIRFVARPTSQPSPLPSRCPLGNRPPNVPKTSRFKGVSYRRWNVWAPWEARITISGRPQSLGYFATEEAAAHAYDHAATMAAGDGALTNARLRLFANGCRP